MLIDKPEHKEMLEQILNSDFAIPIKYSSIAAELQEAIKMAEVTKGPAQE